MKLELDEMRIKKEVYKRLFYVFIDINTYIRKTIDDVITNKKKIIDKFNDFN